MLASPNLKLSKTLARRISIRKFQFLNTDSPLDNGKQKLNWWQRLFSGRRWLVRTIFISANLITLSTALFFIVGTSQAGQKVDQTLVSSSTPSVVNPLDNLSSADVAQSVATLVDLPEATAVSNQAQTVHAELALAPAESVVVAKPQIVATSLKSRADIQVYVTQPGDTLSSIASKFGITANSVKWSNDLTSSTVNPGIKLYIPPVNGIVYTVKAGDTPQNLAAKYSANADQIVSFNDAEINGLSPGEQIVIPDGQQAAPASVLPLLGGTAVFGGQNGYDFGYCTWWVALQRIQAGKPLPTNLGNASSWGYLARAYGLSVGNTPAVGAAVVTSTAGQGHVAYVVQVNGDGSIWVSEMNSYGQRSITDSTPYGGWDRTDYKVWPASSADSFTYIY